MSYGNPPGYGGGYGQQPPPGGGYGGGYGQQPPPGGYGQQPPYGGGYGGQTPPPNHLVWAIISIFLCWPLAIPSIIFASQVNSKFQAGDYAGAVESSGKAKTFALIATILGALSWVFWLLYMVFAVWAVSHTPTYTIPSYTPYSP
jgi:hypothetical protein